MFFLFSVDVELELEAATSLEKMYDCCICKISSTASLERPIGIISLVKTINSKYEYWILKTIPQIYFMYSFKFKKYFKFK